MQQFLDSVSAYTHPRVLAMLFLGFSAGLPLLLIFSTLSIWLSEAGVERSAVTYFSWAALGYSFKFVWAPLVDKLPIPMLQHRLGKRRSWLLLSQLMVISAMLWMAMNDPASTNGLQYMALAAVFLGFSSATQDIVIDAYRIEAVEETLQALMSASYVAGYRIGMVVAGAGALYLAAGLGTTKEAYVYSSWQITYAAMAATMLVGVITTLLIEEPQRQNESSLLNSTSDYLRFLLLFVCFVIALIFTYGWLAGSVETLKTGLDGLGLGASLASFLAESVRLLASIGAAGTIGGLLVILNIADQRALQETYVDPIAEFFDRYGRMALLVLLLIGFYRVSDIVLGVISNVFYLDMGFSKGEIATVTKVFGIWMTILGGFLGGFLTIRYGVLKVLMLGAVMTVVTNLLFIPVANNPGNLSLLYVVIGADNLTAGLAAAAFIAYLSSLTNLSFTAMQYAMFSSIMTLFPKLLGGYSGSMVDALGYQTFFFISSMMGLPVLLLIWLVNRYVKEIEA
ncbi:MAG: MFS transporter [Halieaceae bacterium MED-G27]|jgi:PAT family beta-lactamase induction signal transducer AmpG|nr:MAG: MFS transporter [Halieaceae bacterium MED-G27]